MELYEKFEATDNATGNKVRCMQEENTIFVFAKGKSRYGHRLSIENFNLCYTIKESKIDENTKWKKRLAKAVKYMNESGLWSNIKTVYENLLNSEITYEEKKEICEKSFSFSYKDNIGRNEYCKELQKKYPFMIKESEDGNLYVASDYIYELSDCILKSMYFGKWNNEEYKDKIKDAIDNKKDYHCFAYTNYDVSFEYDTKLNKAWYSEEYKGCGNGHYYLALNNNTAVFCEDD